MLSSAHRFNEMNECDLFKWITENPDTRLKQMIYPRTAG